MSREENSRMWEHSFVTESDEGRFYIEARQREDFGIMGQSRKAQAALKKWETSHTVRVVAGGNELADAVREDNEMRDWLTREVHGIGRYHLQRALRQARGALNAVFYRREVVEYREQVRAQDEATRAAKEAEAAGAAAQERLEAGQAGEEDYWHYSLDSVFLKHFLHSLRMTTKPSELQLIPCACCSSVVAGGRRIELSELHTAGKNCKLCALLLRTANGTQSSDDEQKLETEIIRKPSTLQFSHTGSPILRCWPDPDLELEPESQSDPALADDTQNGFISSLEAGDQAYYALLDAWLRWCDKEHDCINNAIESRKEFSLPTRLIYIGGSNPDVLKLYYPKRNEKLRYVALSHCWGNAQTGHNTTNRNVKARSRGFNFSELPQTFQDAITVTRALQIEYLWIDSLCIIQGNAKDWAHEAKRMEGVFAAAYFTIAATAALDSNAGFLARKKKTEYAYISTQNPDGRPEGVFVSAGMDDFNNDVEKAELNTRAWVMQERVLSGRTIHFSANQTYFECGDGVRCENLTMMKSSGRRNFFTLDPKFPNRLKFGKGSRIIEFLHFLIEDYTRRGLSVNTDRAIAISGLLNFIAKALDSVVKFGIFGDYLHRNLLWQRATPIDRKTGLIEYDSLIPTWSWMAYDGAVQFLDIPFGEVEWMLKIRFDMKKGHDRGLISEMWRLQNYRLEEKQDGRYEVYAASGERVSEAGWIQYDVDRSGDSDVNVERCVILGRKLPQHASWRVDRDKTDVYYVLVVTRSEISDLVYRRAGVGLIHARFLLWESELNCII